MLTQYTLEPIDIKAAVEFWLEEHIGAQGKSSASLAFFCGQQVEGGYQMIVTYNTPTKPKSN